MTAVVHGARGQYLDLTRARIPTGKACVLIVYSTGLSIMGEGEWVRATYGVRGTRGWKKLHLGGGRLHSVQIDHRR